MKKRNAFTLIELLIVVLILGALAAIAIPRITASATVAKRNACWTNIDLLNSQAEMWAANNNDVYPTLAALTTGAGGRAYFPDGPPLCPFGRAYVMSSTTHRIVATTHTHP